MWTTPWSAFEYSEIIMTRYYFWGTKQIQKYLIQIVDILVRKLDIISTAHIHGKEERM